MKYLLIVLLFVISSSLFSQRLQYKSTSLAYSSSEVNNYMENIDEYDSLSIHVREKLDSILINQTGDFSKNFNFYYGISIERKKLLIDYPKYRQYDIPDFIFHFHYCDTTVGISKHELRLAMREQGELILLDFPSRE